MGLGRVWKFFRRRRRRRRRRPPPSLKGGVTYFLDLGPAWVRVLAWAWVLAWTRARLGPGPGLGPGPKPGPRQDYNRHFNIKFRVNMDVRYFGTFFTQCLNIYNSYEFSFIFPRFVHTNLTRRIDARYPEVQI